MVAQTQKLRAMHSVEGTTFASQAGCKLANNTLTTHFVETAVFIVCLGTTFSTRCQFSTKCKPARLKPHQMPMTMFLYRITNLQISIFQKLRNVSSTKCQTWECKTSFSIEKCRISVPNPWHSVEDTCKRIMYMNTQNNSIYKEKHLLLLLQEPVNSESTWPRTLEKLFINP